MNNRCSLFIAAITLVVITACPFQTHAQDASDANQSVGAVERAIGRTEVTRNSQPGVPIAVADSTFRDDVLETFAASLLEVVLNDGSRLKLDENAQLTIAEYVTEPAPNSLLTCR